MNEKRYNPSFIIAVILIVFVSFGVGSYLLGRASGERDSDERFRIEAEQARRNLSDAKEINERITRELQAERERVQRYENEVAGLGATVERLSERLIPERRRLQETRDLADEGIGIIGELREIIRRDQQTP